MAIGLHTVVLLLAYILASVLKQGSDDFACFTCLCFNDFNADKARISDADDVDSYLM